MVHKAVLEIAEIQFIVSVQGHSMSNDPVFGQFGITPHSFLLILKVLYHRQCQDTQANEYHFDGANSIETTNHCAHAPPTSLIDIGCYGRVTLISFPTGLFHLVEFKEQS